MESVSITRFIFALLLVLALIGITATVLRRFGGRQWQGLSGPRRMEMVESLTLDPRYRAVILRCDGKERLLLLGPQSAKELDCQKIAKAPALRKRITLTTPENVDA